MKIKRIKKIKEYKSFHDFNWQSFFNEESFHDDVNIFYGENGSGKSSICNILKNVLAGDNIFNKNTGYKSFGKHEPKDVCVEFYCGECNYSMKKWDEVGLSDQEKFDRGLRGDWWDSKLSSHDAILFFDREFVAKNVHEYERKTTKDGQEQQSGKLIIEFDSNAINLRDVRDKARIARDEQDKKVKDFNETNKEALNFSLNEEEKRFFQKHNKQSDEEIKNTKKDLEKERKEAENNLEADRGLKKKVSNIQNGIHALSKVKNDLFLSGYAAYQAIFNFNIKEQTKIEAEQGLIDKIKIHKSFFDTGFEIRKNHQNQCPFCQSEKEEGGIKKIIDLYNQIYDTTYKVQLQQFEENKQFLISELSHIIQTFSDFDLNSIFLELRRLDQNYKIPNIYLVDDEKKYQKALVKEIKELSDKISKLAKPNKENIHEIYDKVRSEFEDIERFFKSVGDFVEQKNELIVKFKNDNTDEKLQSRIAVNAVRVEAIEKELIFINGGKISDQKKKEKSEENQNELRVIYAELKTKYESALREYEAYCSGEVFLNQLSKIQDYFKNFDFSFKLKLKTDPTGSKTEFPFAFKVLDFEGNERDFKDGLSEGEVQVLSLCFFFAFLDIQSDKDKKILVFDDPITSLDNSNLSCLVDLIAKEQNNFSQTFIFTHHRTFFKFLRKKFGQQKIGCKEFNIIRNKKEFGGSFLSKSHETTFMSKLRSFEEDLKTWSPVDMELKIIEYGQYLRYEVERFIKNDLLHINENKFEDVVDGVKNNQKISKDDLEKIKQIYSFCNWTGLHVDIGDDHGLGQLKGKIAEFVNVVKK